MQNSWYLDDGIIAGTEQGLCESIEIVSTHCNKCGLELRRDKSASCGPTRVLMLLKAG